MLHVCSDVFCPCGAVFKPPATCARIGGCLKETTKDWAHPVTCICEIREQLEWYEKRRTDASEKRRHLSAVEFVNQNGRGK